MAFFSEPDVEWLYSGVTMTQLRCAETSYTHPGHALSDAQSVCCRG